LSARPAFACTRCGACCQGAGGIVLAARDRRRLAGHLGLSEAALVERYAEERGGRTVLGQGPDGYCVFYDQKLPGCGVHAARPDVCRAWPYFRGNLVDEDSWGMAADDCPGISITAGHAEFVRQGRAYLAEHGLSRPPGEDAPNALVVRPGDPGVDEP